MKTATAAADEPDDPRGPGELASPADDPPAPVTANATGSRSFEDAFASVLSIWLGHNAGVQPEGAGVSVYAPAVDCAYLRGDGQISVLQAKHPAATLKHWETLLYNAKGEPRMPARLQLALVPVSHATELARAAQTQEQLGAALRLLREEAELTIDQLTAKLKPKNIAGLSRSTIARVCTGGTLCATSEALLELVRACGVPDADTKVWVDAWTRARNSQRPRGHRPVANLGPDNENNMLEDGQEPGGGADGAATDEATSPAAAEITSDAAATAANDDEVLGTLNMAITRRHLRAAVMLSAMFGLAATTSSSKGVNTAGAVILGLAAGFAMYDMARNLAQSTGQTPGEGTDAGSAAA